MNIESIGQYSKFVVSLAGALAAGLDAAFPGAPWVPAVIACATAVATYVVPNQGPVPRLIPVPGKTFQVPPDPEARP